MIRTFTGTSSLSGHAPPARARCATACRRAVIRRCAWWRRNIPASAICGRLRGYPDVLIFLDTEPETANARQGRSDWTLAEHLKQIQRLREARAACDLYLPTDDLQPDEVADRVEGLHRHPTFRNLPGVSP